MIRVSLVVPFYGVENYIADCLDSLYNQDIPESEYEVICVNDCSLDKSEEVVLEYQKKHSNLRLLRHDTNKKLGAARNTGLSNAYGKYVWFIDSDDFIKSDCLGYVLDCCERYDLDILHWAIQDNHRKWILKMEDSKVRTGIDDLLNGSRDMTFPWNRVYRREFLIKNGLIFNNLWGGDVIHTIQALNYAKRLKNCSDCFYFYRMDNMNSDMRSPVTADKIISFSFVLARALEESKTTLSQELFPLISECITWRVNKAFKPILKMPIKERKVFYSRMTKDKELRDFIFRTANKKVIIEIKYPFLVFLVHPIYRLLMCFRNLINR